MSCVLCGNSAAMRTPALSPRSFSPSAPDGNLVPHSACRHLASRHVTLYAVVPAHTGLSAHSLSVSPTRGACQLLSLMDGAKEEAASVMVAATTCKPNHIGS